jgi:EmrB/QacA subfamily drug resistance transporter
MTATMEVPEHEVEPAVYKRRKAILATMCLSLVLIVATVSSVNVAIPSLARSPLSPTDTQILWVVDAYALVFAALLLPAGALGDRYGRKGALLIGLVIFAAASVAAAFMTNANLLITFRAIMGIGAALIMPSTLSLLQSSFPRAERPKAIATWAGFAGAGGAIGPLLGGFLVEHYWYGSVFLVAGPLAVMAFVASAALAPRSKEDHPTPLDPLGAVLSVVGFAALLAAIIEGPERGWTDVFVVGGFVVAAVGLVGFVLHERRTAHPMLDMAFFRSPRFAAGSMGITFTFLAMFSMFFVLSQYLQYVRGYSPLQSGLRTLPFAATMIAISPRSPAVAGLLGARRTIVSGMVLMASGLVLLSTVGLSTPYPVIALWIVITAAGVALAMPSLSSGILQSVPMNKAGVGSAVNDTTREVGGAIGIAVVGSIVTSIFRDHVGGALSALPPEAAEAARDNVGQALFVAEEAKKFVSPEAAASLKSAVQQAFVDGAHVGLRVGAALVAVASVVVFGLLRDES